MILSYVFLCFLYLAIYYFTLVGNLGLVIPVIEDSWLHNPMSYFLSVLPFLDACYSSVGTPISCQKIQPFHIMGVQHRRFSVLVLGPQNAFLWLPWHMIAKKPSTTH